MGEAFITRKGGNGIKVKAYEPFTKKYVSTSASTNGSSYYYYTDCDFSGRTFLLFASNVTTSSWLTCYPHFAIIENGVIVEEYDKFASYEENEGKSLIEILIDGTTLTVKTSKSTAHAESPLLIEI